MGLYEELTKNDKTSKQSSLYEELTGEKTTTPKKEVKNKENVIGTVARGLTSIGTGFLKGAESIGDALQYGVANVAGLVGADKLKQGLIKNAQFNSTQALTSGAENFYDHYSYKPFKTGGVGDQIVQGVGQVGATIGAGGGTTIGGLVASGVQGYGSGVTTGLEKGQSFNKSQLYGLGNAAIQAGSEGLFGGIGGVLGKGALDDLAVKTVINKIKSNIGKKLTELGIKSIGEGLEENISSALDPILQRMTIDKNAQGYFTNDKGKFTLNKAGQDFLVGATTSALLQSPNIVKNNQINAPQQAIPPNNINTQPVVQTPQQETITQPQTIQQPDEMYENIEREPEEILMIKGEQSKTGMLPKGAEPKAREIALPEETQNGKTSKFFQTAAESSSLDDKGALALKQYVEESKGAYIPLSDQKALDSANGTLETSGYDNSLTTFKTTFDSGKRMSKNDIVLGERLIQEAIKNKDYTTATELVAQVASLGSELGQQVQALYLIKKFTPEGRLKTLQTIVNRENQTNKNLKGKKVEISKEDAQGILSSGNQTDLDNAVNRAINNISEQLPLTLGDKIRSWRYLAMLGNLKTHIRNVVSNIAMKGTATIKNKIASGIEDIVNPEIRTKTLAKSSKEVLEFAKQDASELRDRIQGQDKYDMKSQLNLQKKAFKNKTLNRLSKFNSDMLDAEDWIFSSSAYRNSLSNYLTANKLTPGNITPEQLENARQYAIEQAQELTFRQFNAFANAISQLEKTNTGTQLLIGATLPFKKTPLNIAKAGVEYSPIGLAKTLTKNTLDLKNGNITPAKYIDNISKGLTGTGIMTLGYILASIGLLRGSGSDEDKEEYFQQMQGEQPYSLRIGNMSFTLDWLSPSAMPLFAGAEMFEIGNQKKNVDESFIMKAFEGMSKIVDPLTEMSLLQGVNSTIQSYNTDSPLGSAGAVVLNAGQNYVSQFVPTLFGQLARTTDTKRRSTTGTGKGIDKTLSTFTNKLKAKVPGLANTLEPYTDQFGREQKTGNIVERAFQNFVSPSYIKELKNSNVERAIQKLYDETGEKTILPTSAQRYFTDKLTKYELTPKEYTQFNKTDGKYVTDKLKELVNSESYKKASEEAKVNAIEKVYRAGQMVAKQQYLKEK